MTQRWLDRLTRWIPDPRTLALAAGGLILVGLVAAGVWYWSAATERHARAIYAVALAKGPAARGQQATPEARAEARRELEAAMQSFPSAGLAAEAAYDLGTLRFADRQFAEARSAYERVLARAGSSPTLQALARLGIAATWEAESDVATAVQILEPLVAGMKPGDPFFEQGLLDLGRAYELAGHKDQAVATYRRALTDVARPTQAEDTRMRLASLGAAP